MSVRKRSGSDKQRSVGDVERELEAQRLLNWQLIAADEVGIPLAHAGRLRGADLDEIREDAKEFLREVRSLSRPRVPGRCGRVPGGGHGVGPFFGKVVDDHRSE